MFLKPIKSEPVTKLSRVARFDKPACAIRNEALRYEIESNKKSGFILLSKLIRVSAVRMTMPLKEIYLDQGSL